MRRGRCWQESFLLGLALIGALVRADDGEAVDHTVLPPETETRGLLKFGDRCSSSFECSFNGSVCNRGVCECSSEVPITNHLDKCGIVARVNDSCFFNEQCEAHNLKTECRDSVCVCRFELQAVLKQDGSSQCIPVRNVELPPPKYVDPAMIGILVAMFLMFITICVVLRLFSRARWRENRTIFNTPNPRLMNVSLLRDSKLLHQERRGSRGSIRAPSRQPSMASLRAHSPNSQGRLLLGSRRGSHSSNNASATSTRSNKSPPGATALQHQQQQHGSGANLTATTPMLESVTVDVQERQQ